MFPLSTRRRRIPSSYYNHYWNSIRTTSSIVATVTTTTTARLLNTTFQGHNNNRNNDNNAASGTCGSVKIFSIRWEDANFSIFPNRYGVQFSNLVNHGQRSSSPMLVRTLTTKSSTMNAQEEIEVNINDIHDDRSDKNLSATTTATSESSVVKSSNIPVALNDEWIPPNRPLLGDVGQAHLYPHIEDDKVLHELLSEDERNNDKTEEAMSTDPSIRGNHDTTVDAEVVPPLTSVDWLKTRRSMLMGQKMMKPDEAASYKQSMADMELPIIEHTLYTEQELVQFIEAMGGQDVEVVLDQGDTKKGGRRRLGNDVMGIILVTGMNYVQMQTIATQIVRQLRRRKLEEVDVVGAELGPEGNMNDPNENWYVVDCGNYVVHIQDAKTRAAVNLAALWSGQDPIRKVDCTNDDAVDDYVTKYPVPPNYTVGGSISSASTLLYDVNNWDATMKQFEKTRWTRNNTNVLNAGMSNTRFRNKPIIPKRRRKTSGRKT